MLQSWGVSTAGVGLSGGGGSVVSHRVKSEMNVDKRGSILDYEKLGRVGEGTYGVVYRGRERSTNQIVALKKVRMDKEKDGIPVTAVREMGILQRCRSHPNIVELLKVVQGKGSGIFFVFEYCEHDVGKLMQSMRKPFSVSEVKTLTIQLLSAVRFLHSIHVFHRDLKMSNLLLNNAGTLKLCDLGLARQFMPHINKEKESNNGTYTAKVVTLWYRAPELLLGLRKYGPAIDMWAVGCIIAEFLKHRPIFPGKTEMDTIGRHFAELGAPNESIWPGWSTLPLAKSFTIPNQPYNLLSIHYAQFGDECVDLLVGLLTYDPEKRTDASSALQKQFLSPTSQPRPKPQKDMPTFRSLHLDMVDVKHERTPVRDHGGDLEDWGSGGMEREAKREIKVESKDEREHRDGRSNKRRRRD